MDEMIRYVFASLRISEYSLLRALGNQKMIDRKISIFTVIMIAYATLNELRNLEQNITINKISKELEELKRTKGD